MMKLHLTFLLTGSAVLAQAQGVIVNADGTHSIRMNLGATTVTAPDTNKNIENQQDKSRIGTLNNADNYWLSEPKVKGKKLRSV